MIPAAPGIVATFKAKLNQRDRYWEERVVAFDEDGLPYVAGKHELIPARDRGGFTGIEDHSLGYTALVPGDGWYAELTGEGSPAEIVRIVAWAIKNGVVVPLIATPEGVLDDLEHDRREVRLYYGSGEAS